MIFFQTKIRFLDHTLFQGTYKPIFRVDCKSVKEILQKDVKNIVSKQICARWQALLSSLDFDIDFIK